MRAQGLPTPQPAVSLAKGNGDGTSRQARLREVAKEFESLLVSTLLKSMRETIPSSGLIDDEGEIKYYRQLHDDALAQAAANSGRGFGIAEMLMRRYGEDSGETGAVGAQGGGLTDDSVDEPRWWPLSPGAPVTRTRALGRAPEVVASAAAGTSTARTRGRAADGLPPGAASLAEPAGEAAGVVAPEKSVPAAEPARPSSEETPAAPLAARGIATYRALAADDLQDSRLAQLRAAAAREGGAVADSLRRFEPEIVSAAEATGVDPALLLSVIVNESGGNPEARSAKGAIGLMQLMPGTATEVGVGQPRDPKQNILGGARYLARLLDRFEQSLDLALAGYNAGPGAVTRAGVQVPPYRETVGYVERVGRLYGRLQTGDGMKLASGAGAE